MEVIIFFIPTPITLSIKSHCSIKGTQNINGRNDIKKAKLRDGGFLCSFVFILFLIVTCFGFKAPVWDKNIKIVCKRKIRCYMA